jgi:hypothetical protein
VTDDVAVGVAGESRLPLEGHPREQERPVGIAWMAIEAEPESAPLHL